MSNERFVPVFEDKINIFSNIIGNNNLGSLIGPVVLIIQLP